MDLFENEIKSDISPPHGIGAFPYVLPKMILPCGETDPITLNHPQRNQKDFDFECLPSLADNAKIQQTTATAEKNGQTFLSSKAVVSSKPVNKLS